MTALRAEFAVRLKLFSAIRANQLFGQSRLSIDLFSATGAENVILLQGLAALRADFFFRYLLCAANLAEKRSFRKLCAAGNTIHRLFAVHISAALRAECHIKSYILVTGRTFTGERLTAACAESISCRHLIFTVRTYYISV